MKLVATTRSSEEGHRDLRMVNHDEQVRPSFRALSRWFDGIRWEVLFPLIAVATLAQYRARDPEGDTQFIIYAIVTVVVVVAVLGLDAECIVVGGGDGRAVAVGGPDSRAHRN